MADLAHTVFRLIILHNKLMSEKDLDFFLEKGMDPEKSIARMIASNMITEEVAARLLPVYRKKLAKEKAKLAAEGGGAAAATKPPAAPARAAAGRPAKPPVAAEEDPIPLDDEDEAGPAKAPAGLDETDGEGGIPLAVDHLDEHDLRKADEVGWVDTSEADAEALRSHISDEDRLELSEAVEHHEIVKEVGVQPIKPRSGQSLFQASGGATESTPEPAASPASPKPAAPAAAAAPAASTASAAGHAEVGEIAAGERIPSPVPPGQIDPTAYKLLAKGVELGASDVHLTAGSPPFFRLFGQLVYTDLKPLTEEQALRMVLGFMDDSQQQAWLHTHDIDFSLDFPDLARFRVNALMQFRGPGIIFRIIPRKIPTLADLGLPSHLGRFTEYHQGLVLVTGPAGCGKTTTAAALIDLVNEHRHDHVITVEDPVEFLQFSKNCNVTQRQVPIHTQSFAAALKAALREDPDVIMIGEMRDLETVSLAIRAAETGHLVIGTLQTKSAARTIDRVIDVFPEDQQAQIRAMLSESLRGIITQQLIPRKDGKGRVVALEVLNVVSSVSNLIRDAKTYQLPSLMQTGRKQGQILMDDSLAELLQKGLITKEEALKVSENPKRFR